MNNNKKERLELSLYIRWYLFSSLTIFLGIISVFFYLTEGLSQTLTELWPYYFIAGLIGIYNSGYQLNIRKMNAVSLDSFVIIMLDLVVITAFIWISGGAFSWFWPLFCLLVIESSFLFDSKYISWFFASAASFSFFLLVAYQSFIGVTEGQFPFTVLASGQFAVFSIVIICWVTIMAYFSAMLGNKISGTVRKKESQLSRAAVTDGATGLFNHVHFQRIFNNEASRANRYDSNFSLILIDIDDFKDINDKKGHPEGDRLLKEVADILKFSVRATDTVFRYGGEEFAIIVPETGVRVGKGALALAERIRMTIETLTHVTISAGVGNFTAQGKDCKTLFRNTDNALLMAKKMGKNRINVAGFRKDKKTMEAA